MSLLLLTFMLVWSLKVFVVIAIVIDVDVAVVVVSCRYLFIFLFAEVNAFMAYDLGYTV